jgi:vancomycin aglycone glucosyltransferase
MRVVCTSRGSRGDVLPILEIAGALGGRGHRVTVCVPRSFAAEVAARGLDARYYPEDSRQLMPALGSGWRSAGSALAWVARSLEEQVRLLQEIATDADALVTSATEMAAPSMAEHLRVPHYRIAFAPILPGDQPPPLVPWQGLPRPVNRVLWRGLNGAVGLAMRRLLDEQRHGLGLAPVGAMGEYFAGRCHTLLAISPWLAPPSAAWRHAYRYTGYCHGEHHDPLPEDLEAFLDDGPEPVYVGFGSVSLDDPGRLTRRVLAAAKRAGCRLVLGRGWTGLGSDELPGTAFLVGEVEHQRLFPRLAGVAHHGGSGTVHTAARAGVPQFVMPQLADQFYWGSRVHALGLGPRPAPPGRVSIRELTAAFGRLTRDAETAARARAVARAIGREDGIRRAVQIICRGGGHG